MGDEFEDSADTSSFDDLSTDIGYESDFSETMDIGNMMDDIPAEPIDSFNAMPIDNGVEAELQSDKTMETDSLIDAPADTYTTEDVPSDAVISSALDSSDVSNDIEDHKMDVDSDIAGLMDEVAVKSLVENSLIEDETSIEDTNSLNINAQLDQADSNDYKETLISEIPIIQEDGYVETHENMMDLVDEDTPPFDQDIPTPNLDAEPYKASPTSEMPIVHEDETVDSLENKMDQVDQKTNESNDSVAESFNDEKLPNHNRIDNLNAEKEELPSLNEPYLAYQLEHTEEIDQDQGAIERVFKEEGSDTSVVHHDYDAELADLDKGISELQNTQEEWAVGLKEELKQINENQNLSEVEREELIKENYAKRDLFSENYEQKFAELQVAREELVGKKTSIHLDTPNNVEDITENDVPKIDDFSGWINDINPNYDPFDYQSPYSKNCGSCAFAVEQRLDGNTDIFATSENVGTIEEMEKKTGMEQVSMSPEEIKEYLVSQGSGSHGIVGIDRVSGPGHWFNAYYDGEKLVAIDGQTGEINDWPPDYGDVANWDISVRKEEA